MRIRIDSTEYATGTVTANHDLTGAGVQIAQTPHDSHDALVWEDAEVLGVADNGDGTWTLTYRLLVTAASLVDPGDYDWVVRLTDTPEVIVRRTGLLTVTAH